MCINGRSDLPGPLCQVMIGYDGVCHIIAAGRANHAGKAKNAPPIPAGDGNAMLIGFEWDYSGVAPPGPAQYAAAVLANAACLRRMGRDASYAKGHRETSVEGKPDPGHVDLNKLRADIAARLGGAPPIATPPPGATAPPQTTGGAMALRPTASGKGYWIVGSDGGVFTHGDAGFFGSLGDKKLAAPIVDLAPTPSGKGYWMVGSDGGIFTFGDAKFSGSLGDKKLAAPIVGMAASPSGAGYWLLGKDGGVFTFGDAGFFGAPTGKVK